MELNELYQTSLRSTPRISALADVEPISPAGNPSCGDEISLALEIEGGVIRKVGLSGSGCAISSASPLSCRYDGGLTEKPGAAVHRHDTRRHATEEELEELEDAVAFRGLSKMPARTKCAVLAWHTLEEAVDQWQARSHPSGI